MKRSQAQRLLELLQDGEPHSTVEIMERVYGGDHLGLARVGARVWDLKTKGHEIVGWKDKERPTLFWYQMTPKVKPTARYEPIMVDGVRMMRPIAS